ncbi:unnamed protein product [Alopecurus aequalis]
MADPDWSSLLPDLVRRVGDLLLAAASDVDYYMDMRAVFRNWRSATVDPCQNCNGIELHCLRPRHWVMLDEEEPTDGAHLFVNVLTGRYLRRQVPALREHVLVCAWDGILVVGKNNHPLHTIRVLNPFTGSLLRFKVPLPSYRTKAAVSGYGLTPSLVFSLDYIDDDVVWSADPSSPHARITYGPLVWLASMVAYAGHIYMVDWAGSVHEIVWDDCFTYRHWIAQRPETFVPSYYAPEDSDPWEWHGYYLVEFDGELMLVRRPRLPSETMEVFRVDVERRSLQPVKRVDSALFLGERCLSINADRFPSIDVNCIYYGTDDIWIDHHLQKCQGIYRYDLDDGSEEWISGLLVPQSPSFDARPFSLVQVLVTYCAVLPDVEAQVVKNKN